MLMKRLSITAASLILLAAPLAERAAAQEPPAPVVELSLGWIGFADDGIVVFHISNRYLDLAPVVAGLAKDAGLAGRQQRYTPAAELTEDRKSVPAELVVLSREDRTLGPMDEAGTRNRLDSIPPAKPWTDDYSNIIGAIK